MKTEALIDHLSQFHPKGYDLSLGRITALLDKLDNPHKTIPPVFHVAGTNGKGSATANLRAILEAGGHSVHVDTSPHLVSFQERFRLGHEKNSNIKSGKFVSDDMLAEVLGRVADANDGDDITIFELLAATMFVLFHEQAADYSIVEVGLGGRSDCTNVIEAPLVSIITPVSLDHEMHLGNTLAKIAHEKAGIIKAGCPVVIGPQEDEVREVLESAAIDLNCPMMISGQDFDYYEEAGRFIYQDTMGLLDLPMPNLLGEHQIANSASAIAAVRLVKCSVSDEAYENAMGNIYWPGRFEKLLPGNLTSLFADSTEIWIDGGHNVAAGKIIATELEKLNRSDSKQLVLICAMLTSKNPEAFFERFTNLNPQVLTVPIISSEYGIETKALAGCATRAGLNVISFDDLVEALKYSGEEYPNCRIVICGSLYVVGEALKKNGTPPA